MLVTKQFWFPLNSFVWAKQTNEKSGYIFQNIFLIFLDELSPLILHFIKKNLRSIKKHEIAPLTETNINWNENCTSFLKVPQHYKLMGYQPLSIYDAAATFIPPDRSRTLHTGAQVNMHMCYF